MSDDHQIRPKWAQELESKVESQGASLKDAITGLATKIENYVETLGKLQGSQDILKGVLFAGVGIILATTLGGGLWAGCNQNSLQHAVGKLEGEVKGLTTSINEAKSSSTTAIQTSTTAATSAKAASDNAVQTGKDVSALSGRVDELSKTIANHGTQIGKVETWMKSIDTALLKANERLEKSDAVFGELARKVDDVQASLGQIPKHGREIAVRFQLGQRNRVKTDPDDMRPGIGTLKFEIEFASPAAITPESVSQVRASLDQPRFEEQGIEPTEFLICTPSVEKPNVLTVRISTSEAAAASMEKAVAASKPFLSGQAFVFLRPDDPKPDPKD